MRLSHTIKRIDTFDITVKFDADLEAHIKLWVVPDRELESDEREEMEFDNEGNLIEKPKAKKGNAPAEDKGEQAPAETAAE